MGKQNESRQFSHTCRRCRKEFFASVPPDGGNDFCPDCFRMNLRHLERQVLEDYAYFGGRARIASVNLFADGFSASSDSRARKFYALRVFEEMMLATEDLGMLYYALSRHRTAPVLETLLSHNLDGDKWLAELDASTPDGILERMGLASSGMPLFVGPGVDAEGTMAALRTAVSGLRDAALLRRAEDGVLVEALNKLKHGFVAVSLPDWIDNSKLGPNDVAIVLHANKRLGRLDRYGVEASEDSMRRMVNHTNSYANLISLVITIFLGATAPDV